MIFLYTWFKKKTKTRLFSEVLDQIKNKIVTSPLQCHFYLENNWKIYEWDIDLPIKIGDEIQVHEYYSKDNIWYRNSFVHVVV